MTPRGILLTLAPFGVLLALLAVLGAQLHRGVGLGFAVPFIEGQLQTLLGRAVTLVQPPRLRIGKTVDLELGDMAIANAPWAAPDPLLSASRLKLRVSSASLWRGPVVIESLEAQGLHLSLARSAEGLSNLPDLSSGEDGDDGFKRLPVIVRNARITDVTVSHHDLGTGKKLDWRATGLRQSSSVAEGLRLAGDGTLQARPWTLALETTAMEDIASDAPFDAAIDATLSGATLTGKASLPALSSLHDLTLSLLAQGQIPPEIAELSPLLTADTPLRISLDARDINPGIVLSGAVRLPNLTLSVSGEVHRPLQGDGFLVEIGADAADVRPLTDALRLGDVEHLPLTVRGKLARDGRAIRVENLQIAVGEHRISGELDFPAFPHTDGASLDATASGPDFGFYQRLLERPISFPYPYTADLSLRKDPQGVEMVASEIRIGEHELVLAGPLGDFPHYRGSDLRFTLQGPDINALSGVAGVAVPARAYRASGEVSVDEDQRIRLRQTQLQVGTLRLAADGALNGYPAFDGIDLALRLHVDSLAETARTLELEKLPGDVPATLDLWLSGSPQALQADALHLRSSGLDLRSERGAVSIKDGAISSTLALALTLEDPATLLGEYASDYVPPGPFTALVLPRLDGELIAVDIEQLDGPSVRGEVQLRIARDFSLDERTRITADLRVDEPARLLPRIDEYDPPTEPIQLTASTSLEAGENRIDATLSAGDSQMMLVAYIPAGEVGRLRATIKGSGSDLHALGNHPALPGGALPFSIDANVTYAQDSLVLSVAQLEVAGSRLSGDATYRAAQRELDARIEIPTAELDRWLQQTPGEEKSAKSAEKPAAKRNTRLIPDRPLPLDWLDTYTADITLVTGDLGISDPLAPDYSLIESITARARSGAGAATLEVDEVAGHRGSGSGRLAIRRESGNAAVDVKLTLQDIPLGLRLAAGVPDRLPRLTVETELAMRGATTRQLAATLNGPLLIRGGPGAIRDADLGFVTSSFIDQLVNALLPMVKENRDLDIICTVLAARAVDGKLLLDPGLVMRSGGVDFRAQGQIDLSTEKLRISFNNQARKGLGISAAGLINPYVEITGTLARPAIGLDVMGSAIATGTTVATGGLSVVARTFYGRFLNKENPCASALELWEKSAQGSAPPGG